MNLQMFEGNLGENPELRYAGRGPDAQPVTTLRVCSNRRRRLEDGTYETIDELWMNVEAWGQIASNAVKCLRKGAPVVVFGELRDNSYERDGKRVPSVKLVAQHIGLNVGRVDNVHYDLRRANGSGEARDSPRQPPAAQGVSGNAEDYEDALPPPDDGEEGVP